MPQLLLTTPPIAEPLTIADAKVYLRVDDSVEDPLIADLVASARATVEGFCKVSLLPTVWTYRLAGFPAEIRLPVGPVFSADNVAIAYVDDAGATQTLAAAEYQVSVGETASIRPAYGKLWPATRPQLDAVGIEFTAGWETAAEIPPAVMAGLRSILADLYDRRGAGGREAQLGARNLLMPYVRWS